MEENNNNGNKKAGVPTNLDPVDDWKLTRWDNDGKKSYTIKIPYFSHGKSFEKPITVFPREVKNFRKAIDAIERDIVSNGFKA